MHSKQLLQLLKPLSIAVDDGNKVIPLSEYINIKDGFGYVSNGLISIKRKISLPDMILPYRKLISILSVIDGEVIFNISDTAIKLSCGKIKYELGKPVDASNFVMWKEIGEQKIKVDADFFFACEQAAKNEDPREISNWRGIFIGANEVVGNDNYGMFRWEKSIGIHNIHASSIFAKATQGWQAAEISTDERHLQCKSEDIEIDCILIDKNFPNFNVVMPQEFTTNCVINRESLETAIKQAQVFEQGIISFLFLPNEIEIAYRNDYNESGKIKIEATHVLNLSVNFDSKILSRLLSCLPSDCKEINMQITSSTKAVFIIHNNITLLIMPYAK